MAKLIIEVSGNNSHSTKISVDDKQIGMIREFQLKANAETSVLDMVAKFPDMSKHEIPKNSVLNKIPEMIELLESCNVKCELVPIALQPETIFSKEEINDMEKHYESVMSKINPKKLNNNRKKIK